MNGETPPPAWLDEAHGFDQAHPKPPMGDGWFNETLEAWLHRSPAEAALDAVVQDAIRAELEAEERIASTARALGCGYAVVEEWRPLSAVGYRRHYVVSGRVPPMERMSFPSWGAFEEWRDRA